MSLKPKLLALSGSLVLALLTVILYWVSVSGAALNPTATTAKLWVTPLSIDFGPVGVGFKGVPQAVTITNLGSTTLTNFAGGGVAPPFRALQNCAGGVAPGASCQYTFYFEPTATGTFTAVSHSSTNAGSFNIALRGEGVGAELHVTPLSLDFGSVYVGVTTTAQTVTIRNTGLSTLTNFAGGGVLPPFDATQNCASGVAPGASCQYFFRFEPTATGTFTAVSHSSTNAGPIDIALKGVGRSILFGSGQRVTPLSIDFGPVGVGFKSGPQIVTVTNLSPFVAITEFAGGAVNPPFSASQNCAPTLEPGASCQYFFRFAPSAAGIFTAASNSSTSAGSFSIALRGEGVGAGLHVTPLSLDFGPVPLFTTSAPQFVTIRNTGLTTLTNFAGGGVWPPFSALQNCAGGVAPGASCQYIFRFAPTAIGRPSAISSSSTNAGSFSIQLYGGEMLYGFLPLVMRQ